MNMSKVKELIRKILYLKGQIPMEYWEPYYKKWLYDSVPIWEYINARRIGLYGGINLHRFYSLAHRVSIWDFNIEECEYWRNYIDNDTCVKE